MTEAEISLHLARIKAVDEAIVRLQTQAEESNDTDYALSLHDRALELAKGLLALKFIEEP